MHWKKRSEWNRFALTLVLMVAFARLPAQPANEIQDLEAALAAYAGPDTGRVNRLNELGFRYWIVDPSQSITMGEEALKLAEQANYAEGRAFAQRVVGVGHWARGNKDLAYHLLLDAREGYVSLGDSLGLANTELNIGMVYADQKEYDLAARSYQSALASFRRLGLVTREATAYTKIADLLTEQSNYVPAFDYLRRALGLHEQAEFTYGIGEVNGKLGRLALKQEDYDKAISHFLLAIGAGSQRFDHVGMGESLYGIGLAYLRNGKYALAEDYLERAEHLADGIGLLKLQRDVTLAHKELSERHGNYRAALTYADRYRQLTDTLYDQELTALMTGYEARRSYARQQEELDRATTELQFSEQRRKNERLTRWLLLLVLLLVATTAWFLVKLKDRAIDRKRKDLLASESRTEELREELHDRERQLTANALNLANKSGAIADLKGSLDGMRKKLPQTMRGEFGKLTRQVSNLIETDTEWEDFRKHFEAVHPDLIVQLKQRYPDLTQNEFRLIALLRLNLNTKEMSSILGISPDSVKTARYRLRRKMDLPTGTNLYDFLLTLN